MGYIIKVISKPNLNSIGVIVLEIGLNRKPIWIGTISDFDQETTVGLNWNYSQCKQTKW